jgi:hypothetical protein
MLRDWTRSKKMAKLSSCGERLFTRLISVADDFGNYPANVKLINGTCFPEHPDVIDLDVAKWIDECDKVGVIRRYTVDGTKYIHIVNFGQRLDKARAKYPREHEDPYFTDDVQEDEEKPEQNTVPELPGTSGKIPAELETEYEHETETETSREKSRLTVWPGFDDFWDLYAKKVDRPKCEKKWQKISQGVREKIMQHLRYYVDSTPDPQYRKNPATYLNNQSWENEIIKPLTNGAAKQITATGTLTRLNSYTD